MSYSQNAEEQHILEFFHRRTGRLLSIGENDGRTLSNALALIDFGWSAVLVEPGETAFKKLQALHKKNKRVKLVNNAISDFNGPADFFESEVHKPLGMENYGLLSTLDKSEIRRWNGTENFNAKQVQCIDVAALLLAHPGPYDFISIDAEGADIKILQQIDLSDTQLLCVEWNSNPETKAAILQHCRRFNMQKIIYQSFENILIAR